MNLIKKILGDKPTSRPASIQHDFIAIGDIVIDNFIRLTNAHETINKETHSDELCMVFGTKLPFEFNEEIVAVGNSANAAVAAARIGLDTGLVAHVGADENGQKCIAKLKEEHITTEFISVHAGMKTNYHFVLWFGSERTILIKHENFPLTLPDMGSPKWLYLSSLSEHSLGIHTTIADYLDSHPGIKLVFQPGTFQIKFGTEALARIYKHTELFFCNLEEAQTILHIDPQAAAARDIKKCLGGLRALGPRLPVITDGPHGAYTYVQDETTGGEYVGFLPIYPDVAPPYERTGAGDAFAATFSAALALNKPISEAMKWGSINSMSVCQKVGAQEGLLSKEQIEEYLKKAPAGWEVQKVD